MKDARFTIPTPALLAKVVDLLDHVPMDDRDTKGDLYEYMLGKIATRRPERPVPHAAPHHPADGGDDGADAEGRDLRSGLRHLRLPGRGRRVPARAPSRRCSATQKLTRAFPPRHVPRLRLRQHDAAHRQHEHAAARRREPGHQLPRLAGAGARRRGGGATSLVLANPPFAGSRSTTRTSPRTCCRSSRPRRPSCCSWRCSCGCSSPAAAPR